MSAIWKAIKWCYHRSGQVFCFGLALICTNQFTEGMYDSPDLSGTLLIAVWLATGLTLRWQMISKK